MFPPSFPVSFAESPGEVALAALLWTLSTCTHAAELCQDPTSNSEPSNSRAVISFFKN